MLDAGIPNIEMHIYGNGFHPGSGSTGGLTDRNGTPLGTWQFRFIDWARDLGFLQKPGLETKAAKDTAEFLTKPAPRPYVIRRTEPNTNAPARQP
jgi:endo-1,4-beta-xylanase